MRLKDKVAIVTGGARGIGRAIAVRFAARGGACVAIVDVRESEGLDAAAAIEAAGGKALFVRTDVTSADQVKTMVQALLTHWQHIDILVNDAAICPFEEFLEMPEALWDSVLDTNLKGYFLVSQAVAHVMVEQKTRGRIIAISSISAEFGGSQQAHYCASKAGINLLVKSMAISLGPFGITCNAVLPGTVETDINRDRRWRSLHSGSIGRSEHRSVVWAGPRTSQVPPSSSPPMTRRGAPAPRSSPMGACPSTFSSGRVYGDLFHQSRQVLRTDGARPADVLHVLLGPVDDGRFLLLILRRDDGQVILVDPGMRHVDEIQPLVVAGAGDRGRFRMDMARQNVPLLLAKEGIDPADVKYVLLTHLHYDHCSNAKLFPNAQFLVSRRGLHLTINPPVRGMTPDILFPRTSSRTSRERRGTACFW